jgi:hypothetical protein
MRKRYLLLSLLSVFILLASTHDASADWISDVLDSVKGKARISAVNIVRPSNDLMFRDSPTAEKSNWIDVTDQFIQAGKIRKNTFALSTNESLSK